MKQVFKRIISFMLSICIIAVSVLLYSSTVYALPKRLLDGTWVDVPISEYGQEISYFLQYAVNQMGAVYNGDFEGWLKNNNAYSDLYDDNGRLAQNISIDQETGNVTISADLVALIKQALIEYAEETNPFYIMDTIRAKSVLASTFASKEIYQEFIDYTSSHRITAFNAYGNVISGYMLLGDVTPIIKGGGGFVVQSGDPKKDDYINTYTLNGNWLKENIKYDRYDYTFTDGAYSVDISENHGVFSFYNFYINNYPPIINSSPFGNIVTEDGGRIRVFKSQADFINYDAGQRKVYFGSGFYDFDPTDITATWDEISDAIGRMDDIMQDILDAITDNPNLSEEDLEKLIDELSGKLSEIGDKTDQTNTLLGGISSTLDGIASSLSGYFSSVLSALDDILAAINALVWIEADDKLDEDKSDLFDLIDKIWKDPQNGSQEAADALTGSFSDIAQGLTKKFPFSIPWDIYNLFRVFSGAPAPDEASFRPMTLSVQPFTVDNEDLEQDIHDAPYFKLPLRLDSYGIYEEVVIDLSDFKSVSTLSRGLLSVLFAVFLIKFTIRIIDLFKGGVGD